MDWEIDVVRQLQGEMQALFGHGPQSVAECKRLAARFDCQVRFHAVTFTFGLLLDNVIHLPEPTPANEGKLLQIFWHELAEAGLRWEGTEPYCYPPEFSDQARHRIACKIEAQGVSGAEPAISGPE